MGRKNAPNDCGLRSTGRGERLRRACARNRTCRNRASDIINLGIGQPDFKTPQHIVEAAIKALRDGHHGYTPANGLLATREAVVRRTLTTTGVEISPESGDDPARRQADHVSPRS